jgi:CheY-like chemotaxis protein
MRWLRQQPRTKHLPVIVLGVERDAYSVTRAYELGGSSYLVKPKDQKSFIHMITEAATYWTRLNHPPE